MNIRLRLQFITAGLATASCMGVATLLAPPVAAHGGTNHTHTRIASEDQAIKMANKAIDTFVTAESDAYDLTDKHYYEAIARGASASDKGLDESIAALESFDLGPTLTVLHQQLLRLNRQMTYIQENAEQQDKNGLQNSINGFYETVNEYDTTLTDYSYETGFSDPDYVYDYSEADEVAFDRFTLMYLLAAWVLFGISVGTTVWAIQKPRYIDSSKLRLLRLIITCTAWSAFIAIATGLGAYLFLWYDNSFSDIITVIITAVVLVGLYIYYVSAKKQTQRAATPSVTTPPKKHA